MEKGGKRGKSSSEEKVRRVNARRVASSSKKIRKKRKEMKQLSKKFIKECQNKEKMRRDRETDGA